MKKIKNKKCIIIANGKAPNKKAIDYFIDKGFTTIICADGGANTAKKINIIPDFIIGDLDSIADKTILYFKSKSNIIKFKRQNDTDIEKCLKFAVKNGFKEVVLLGVTGNRLDHTICNLSIVIKFHHKIKIYVAAENSFLIPFDYDIKLKSVQGETISFFAFDDKTYITSLDLKYPLSNTNLKFGIKESASNVSISESIDIKISGGVIFIIRDFNFVRKHDLF